MRYGDLGVEPVINAAATFTWLGGSLMPPVVIEAMAEAARNYVDLHHLHEAAGRLLADRTRNEAACVTAGAAAGITLAVSACLSRKDAVPLAFPPGPGSVVMFRGQRNGYDYAVRQSGAQLIDAEGNEESLRAALAQDAACVLWFEGPAYRRDALPIEPTIAIAAEYGVPVLVDAAAQIPPVSTLWHYTTELGADAVILSGGKGLRGPQASGLVLGRRWIVDSCHAQASPNAGIGRTMKVGKEEIMALTTAVCWTLDQHEPATIAAYEDSVQLWLHGLADLPGVTVRRDFPSEAGQPHARAVLSCDGEWTAKTLTAALWERRPRIALGGLVDDPTVVALNPQTLQPGEDRIVLAALREVLT
jgi:L-seryl-tRNA(Ser) seleniumtransferase